jgi:acyl transferase domain-containing protein
VTVGVDTVLVFEGQGAREIPGEPAVDLTALPAADAQVAIVAHQVARARPWLDRGDGAVIGQSLGEISALVVAGALDLDDALAVVRLRAELPATLLAPRPWTMASLTRTPHDAAREASDDLELWVVGENGPADEIVVGTADAFAVFAGRLALSPSTYRILPVAHPYHTPLLAPEADELRTVLDGLPVRDPVLPVWSPTGPREVTGAAGARAVIVDALVSPVRWSTALTEAAARWPGVRWRECGPSGSLYRFTWKNGLRDLDWAEA